MYVCLGWLIDMDGDLALINPTRPVIKGEFGQDPKEGCKENLRPTLKLVAPVPSPSFPLRYWSSKALKILRYCNITIPYLTYKTFQTLIKSPNIHKWGETFQIPRHRSKWPNKNCLHHKGGGGRETSKPTFGDWQAHRYGDWWWRHGLYGWRSHSVDAEGRRNLLGATCHHWSHN